MKIKLILLSVLCGLFVENLKAQQQMPLTIKEAVSIALKKSDESAIADTRVKTAESEMQVVKNYQYPDLKLSGQYQHLTNADVNLKLNADNSSSGAAPDVNQLLLGQATASVPLFSGFKLKNLIESSENSYQAVNYKSRDLKEQIALQTIRDYITLYNARKTVKLIEENLRSSEQRVKDLSAMERNGILARNDLLKAELQKSNIALNLEEAKKNEFIINYKLVTFLKLPENTIIDTPDDTFGMLPGLVPETEISRNDLEALRYQERAAENQIRVAQSKLYPSLSLVGGYIAADLKNVITVTNAMNVGVGVSYNLTDIFKSKSDIIAAKSKAEELQHAIDLAEDQVKVQVAAAEQDYQVAIRKYDVYIKSDEQAKENYRIVKDKFDNGLADTNDLLEADVDQLQAQINLTTVKANITQKYYELLTAQGQLTNTITQN